MGAETLEPIALSIRQPWAWLIIHGGKDIENRNWPTRFRGRLLVHASKGMTREEYRQCARFIVSDSRIAHLIQSLPPMEELPKGGIVGSVDVIDCVTESGSPWFVGDYGFVLRKPRAEEFFPIKGTLGFFRVPTFPQ